MKEDDRLVAHGPMARVGQKQIVLAQRLEADGETIKINRQRRAVTGTVTSTYHREVRGAEHLLAMVEAKESGDRIAVDLGPIDELDFDVEEGESLTFTGVPIKVKNTRLLLAYSLKHDGKLIRISRQKDRPAKS